MSDRERGKCNVCLHFTFNYSTQRCDDLRCETHVWREERTCKRCGTEYAMGLKAANSPCPNDVCREAEFARKYAPTKRTEESVQEELTRAINAQDDNERAEQLTWEFIKANPAAPFEQARTTVEAFIAWRDAQRKEADARVEELHKEWRSFKDDE